MRMADRSHTARAITAPPISAALNVLPTISTLAASTAAVNSGNSSHPRRGSPNNSIRLPIVSQIEV